MIAVEVCPRKAAAVSLPRLLAITVSGPSVPAQADPRVRETGCREEVRAAQAEANSQAVDLFMSAPAAMAMFLGHYGNMIRDTNIYDHNGETYLPTTRLLG